MAHSTLNCPVYYGSLYASEVCPRNVLVSGAMGTGKKLAAELI